MYSYQSSEDQGPVMWLRGYPLYAAHVIVLVFVVSMLATTLLQFANAAGALSWLTFSSSAVLQGQIWRIATYGFVNAPSLWFVIDMFMIAWFGREVERAFGRKKFFTLYGCLYVLTPLLFTVIGFWRPTSLAGQTGGFALFIAFATLHPNMPMLFNILAKWVAVIFVAINTLMALSRRDVVSLLSIWATVAFAFAFVRHEQGRFALPRLDVFKPKPKLRVLPDLKPPRSTPAASSRIHTMAEVDALLDKIAQSGISSLTSAERAKLDAAQADLLKRKAGK